MVPDRGRRYLQAALITSVPVTVIALPMNYRQGSQPPSKAMMLQDFTAKLGCYSASSPGCAWSATQSGSPGTGHLARPPAVNLTSSPVETFRDPQ
jgi:hypothetical protein